MSFATKRVGPSCCTLFTFITCYQLQITLSQNYLLLIISVLAENTLLKTTYHFLLLLVGFDTLTYRKGYDRSPTLLGHHIASSFVDLHLLTLHIMPVNMARVPVSRTYMYMMSTSPLLHHHRCLLLLGTVIRGCIFRMISSLYCFWLCWIASA